MKNTPRHKARMAEVRKRGHAPSKASLDRPGGLAGLAERMAAIGEETGQPWRRAEYHDADWRQDADELAGLLANELMDVGGDDLEWSRLDGVDEDEVAVSATVNLYLQTLTDRLGDELDKRVKAGSMTRREQRRELERFETATADEVAQRMAPHLLHLLRRKASSSTEASK